MAKQLTKEQLQNSETGDVIVEKLFNETYVWVVLKVKKERNETTLNLSEVGNSSHRSKLIVGSNFNKEGDRRYKSSSGNVIVKYYQNEI